MMGDAADALTEENLAGYEGHLNGDCACPCIYCDPPRERRGGVMPDLSAFDDAFDIAPLSRRQGGAATTGGTLAAPADPGPMANGVYTIVFPDGSHKSFKVHTRKLTSSFAPGQRILSILIGPDNSSDWQMFGFVTAEGIKVWGKHRGEKLERYAGILWAFALECDTDGCDVKVAKHCMRCNRLLNDPASIAANLGPECRKRR